jgi:FkbM family methyltransferase
VVSNPKQFAREWRITRESLAQTQQQLADTQQQHAQTQQQLAETQTAQRNLETATNELSGRVAKIETVLRNLETATNELVNVARYKLTPETAFELAYGRPIPSSGRERLAYAGVHPHVGDIGVLRSVIAAFDRQTYPTPITIRFGAAQTETVSLDGFDLVLDTDDLAVSRSILGARNYEVHLRGFVERVLHPGMTVIDIGANIGFYTMLFASIVGQRGKVIAFEPNTENNRLILLSVEKNRFSHVRTFPVALGESPGAVFFSPHIGSNGGLMPSTGETLLDPNCTVVPCLRLDQVIDERLDFIKVDIEGGEYHALLGATKLIEKWHPIITTEFSMEMLPRVSGIAGGDFIRWLQGFGYASYVVARDMSGLKAIDDVDRFVAEWGDPVRIEDLAFWPANAAFPLPKSTGDDQPL